MTKTKINFNQIVKDSNELANSIQLEKYRLNYKAIHGIPNGGIAVMIIIGELLKLKMLSINEYKKYKNKKKVLVVDDLIDTGETLKRYSESDTAVLYKKPHSPKPTYWLKDIGSKWIILPHEKENCIKDNITRIFSYINIQLNKQEQNILFNLLNKIKKV